MIRLQPYSSLAAAVCAAVVLSGCHRPPQLETVTAGGDGPPTLVLLHGFGSSAEQWMPFSHTIRLPPGGRFIFPQAPGTNGPQGGRAWWPLELAANIPKGGTVPDLSATNPPGLKTAAALVRDLLQSLRRSAGGPIVLGGYSQGAMVASEVAFQSNEEIAALVLLSGTPVAEATWDANYTNRRGLPVFMSHGRGDTVLPFDGALRMKRKLEAAGLQVTWIEFQGGHEIPVEVVVALNEFLARLRLS